MKQFYNKILSSGSLVIGLLTCIYSKAQDNFLDASFGTNGIVTTTRFNVKAVSLQEDGKILVAGGTNFAALSSMNDHSIIYRFNSDGTPDPGFGTDGKVTLTGANHGLIGIQQLPDGEIIALGRTISCVFNSAVSRFTLFHLNSDGNINAQYTVVALQPVPAPTRMILLPDGKILGVGSMQYPQTGPFTQPCTISGPMPLIARFNTNFSLDTTFGDEGYKILTGNNGILNAVVVNSDGSIVAGAQVGSDIKLFKFLPEGQPDVTFGSNGVRILDFGSSDDRINQIILLEDGKLLLSGSRGDASQGAVLCRTLPDGTPDSTYGNAGLLIIPNNTGNNEIAVGSIMDNNKIISGLQKWNASQDYGLLFTTDEGVIDYGTANNGQIETLLEGAQQMTALTKQPDGKIVVVGYDENAVVLARYDLSSVLGTASFNPANLTVYPNPADDKVTIKGLPDLTVLELYSISGQKFQEVITNGDTVIDIGSFASGMYFVKTQYGIAKIVKR